MQRNHQADAEQDSQESLSTTLSRAAGWLNPFNLIRSGASKVMATSAVLFNLVGSAEGWGDCFYSEGRLYWLACIPSIQDAIMANLTDACGIVKTNITECASTYNYHPLNMSQGFGTSTFGESVCRIASSGNVELLDSCIYDVLKANAVSGYGTAGDIIATIMIPIGAIMVGVMAGTISYLMYERSSYAVRREAHKKYDPMTQALADNDVALLKEINQLAVDSNCTLPKDLAFMILKKIHKNSDQPINGAQANGIRFFDTVGRQSTRVATLETAWEQIKLDRATAKMNAKLLDDVSDGEDLVSVETDYLIPKI